ncbi:MAG: ribbon-helix-helix protein, CopG family [bacterium]|nr:ribbon-helix-helix protein, CopG family [bacterium]MDE0437229.1 ribbon-helix-helix protein, CopG family [bacterium]
MLSFRLAAEEVAKVGRWAERLGVGRSELIRESLRRYLTWLESADDSKRWEAEPLREEESAIAAIADWGVAEEWSDWTDATG